MPRVQTQGSVDGPELENEPRARCVGIAQTLTHLGHTPSQLAEHASTHPRESPTDEVDRGGQPGGGER